MAKEVAKCYKLFFTQSFLHFFDNIGPISRSPKLFIIGIKATFIYRASLEGAKLHS